MFMITTDAGTRVYAGNSQSVKGILEADANASVAEPQRPR